MSLYQLVLSDIMASVISFNSQKLDATAVKTRRQPAKIRL